MGIRYWIRSSFTEGYIGGSKATSPHCRLLLLQTIQTGHANRTLLTKIWRTPQSIISKDLPRPLPIYVPYILQTWHGLTGWRYCGLVTPTHGCRLPVASAFSHDIAADGYDSILTERLDRRFCYQIIVRKLAKYMIFFALGAQLICIVSMENSSQLAPPVKVIRLALNVLLLVYDLDQLPTDPGRHLQRSLIRLHLD